MEQGNLDEFLNPEIEKPIKRAIILDLNSLARVAYSTQYNVDLGVTITMPDGQPKYVKTTMISNIIKRVATLSAKGYHPIYACKDQSIVSRKAYMKGLLTSLDGEEMEYKGGRQRTEGEFFDGMTIIENILTGAGVPVLGEFNYEADDLIYALANAIHEHDPEVHIDVITGDSDLIPMCKDNLSVYYKTKKHTYYEAPHPRRQGYSQVTPNSYQDICEDTSKTKNLTVPYNTLLLTKILRGDSDNVPVLTRAWSPTNYNEFVDLYSEFINLPYSEYDCYIQNTVTGDSYSLDNIPEDKTNLKKKFVLRDTSIDLVVEAINEYEDYKNALIRQSNEEIRTCKERTGKKSTKKEKAYLDLKAEDAKKRYLGMNLNAAFLDEMGMKPNEKRQPKQLVIKSLTTFDYQKLKSLASTLAIRLD